MNQRKSEPPPYKVVRQFAHVTRACARHAVLRRTSQNLTFRRREQRDNESDTWLSALAVIRLRPPDVVNDRRRRVALFIKHLMADRFASSACAPCSTRFVPPRCYCERRCYKARSERPGPLRGPGQAQDEMPSAASPGECRGQCAVRLRAARCLRAANQRPMAPAMT